MRKILFLTAITASLDLALVCQPACARDLSKIQIAQATTTPAAEPTPASPAPAAPAPQPAPAAQAQPDAAPQPAAKPSKPAKKRVAKHRSWEADEAKARGIAAKYGVSW
jgi:outer membrane biosynthesis protein TonB